MSTDEQKADVVAWQAKGSDGGWRYVEMPKTATAMGMEVRALVPQTQALAEIERLTALIDGDNCPDADKIGELFSRAEEAATTITALEAERDHWKANHAEMVARNRVLRDRPDLPVDRLPALDHFVQQAAAQQATITALQERIKELEGALNIAVSRGCDHCSESIGQARSTLKDSGNGSEVAR